MTEAETAVLERLARIETDLKNLRGESEAIRSTLHSLIGTALANHEAAIARLSAAHDHRLGVWWTLLWVVTGAAVLIGAGAWLIEHQVQIVVKP